VRLDLPALGVGQAAAWSREHGQLGRLQQPVLPTVEVDVAAAADLGELLAAIVFEDRGSLACRTTSRSRWSAATARASSDSRACRVARNAGSPWASRHSSSRRLCWATRVARTRAKRSSMLSSCQS